MSALTSGEHLRALFGENVRNLRKAGGFTQTEFAKRAGITQGVLSQIENGVKGFTSDSLAELATKLGCKPTDLIFDGKSAASGLDSQIVLEQQSKIEALQIENEELTKRLCLPTGFEEAYRSASQLRRELALAILRNDNEALVALAKKVVPVGE